MTVNVLSTLSRPNTAAHLLTSERDTIRGVQIRAGVAYVCIYIYVCMEVRVA